MQNQDWDIRFTELDLSIARNDFPIHTGLMTSCFVQTIEDINANVKIKFDRTDIEPIPLTIQMTFNWKKFIEKQKPGGSLTETQQAGDVYFSKAFITNEAVGAGALKLCFSRNVEIQTLLRVTGNIYKEGVLQQVVTIGTTATPIPATALDRRTGLTMYNRSGVTIYLGSSTVTKDGVTQGAPLENNTDTSWPVASSVIVYGIVAAGTANLNIIEGR